LYHYIHKYTQVQKRHQGFFLWFCRD